MKVLTKFVLTTRRHLRLYECRVLQASRADVLPKDIEVSGDSEKRFPVRLTTRFPAPSNSKCTPCSSQQATTASPRSSRISFTALMRLRRRAIITFALCQPANNRQANLLSVSRACPAQSFVVAALCISFLCLPSSEDQKHDRRTAA